MTKKKFLMQGFVLTLIALFMLGTNMIYRSYLSSQIGAEGMGLYQLIFSVFTLATTLSTSGISLAVTRLVSKLIAQGKREEIRSAVKKCLLFCLSLSLSISFLFLFCSNFIALNFLKNISAGPSLRILGLGLPFMSICTCIKGYFLAVDEGVSCAIAELCEHIITIGGTFAIFTLIPFENIETACVYAMIASTIGEISSFLIDMTSLKFSFIKNTPKKKAKSHGIFKALAHIALPCTFSSATRSFLSTTENLLIPLRLQKGGFSYSKAMSQYGLLQGMAYPILYFPAALIGPFSSLLIPKICRERELSHPKSVAYITSRATGTAVSFGVISAGFFFTFGSKLAEVFFQNAEAGLYISILAPLAPLMYLDIVLDGLLKGLDQQLNSMKYNIIDSSIRVVLVSLLLSKFGMSSYICIIFFSMIFNVSLSFSKVIRVTGMTFSFVKKLIYQIPIMLFCIALVNFIPQNTNEILDIAIKFVLCYGTYGFLNILIDKKLD